MLDQSLAQRDALLRSAGMPGPGTEREGAETALDYSRSFDDGSDSDSDDELHRRTNAAVRKSAALAQHRSPARPVTRRRRSVDADGQGQREAEGDVSRLVTDALDVSDRELVQSVLAMTKRPSSSATADMRRMQSLSAELDVSGIPRTEAESRILIDDEAMPTSPAPAAMGASSRQRASNANMSRDRGLWMQRQVICADIEAAEAALKALDGQAHNQQ